MLPERASRKVMSMAEQRSVNKHGKRVLQVFCHGRAVKEYIRMIPNELVEKVPFSFQHP